MSQRKCGTCSYFEEGGIASSGWCRHPERQDLQHTVLVRKTELACRTGHGRVLWEPAGVTAERPRAIPGQDIELVGVHAVRPAMFAASTSGSDQSVLRPSESVALRPGQRFLDDDESDDFLNPLIARVRDTSRTQPATSAGQPGGGPTNHSNGPGGAGSRQSDPVSARDLSITWGAKFSELQRQGQEEPADRLTPEAALPRRGPDSTEGAEPSPTSRHDRDEQQYGDNWPPAHRDTSPQGTDVANRFGAYVTELSTERRSAPVPQSGSTQEIDFPEFERSPLENAEPDYQRQQLHSNVTMRDDVGDAEESESAPVAHPSIDELPRCCRTCRDFRPIDGGARGVCNNAYAVTSERMVEPDDLPCDGTFGSWWTPTDDWWRGRADISHHYAPTPLVDDMVRSRSAQTGDDGSTERRRKT